MTLSLDDTRVRGKNLKTRIKLSFADKDISGSADATTSAELGTKAKMLTVELLIPFERALWLSQITELAEAKDGSGQRKTYRIINDAANAMHFYQGKFANELTVDEQSELDVWRVSFSMREVLSVPERKAQRESLPAAQQQSRTNDGVTVTQSADLPPDTAHLEALWSGVMEL